MNIESCQPESGCFHKVMYHFYDDDVYFLMTKHTSFYLLYVFNSYDDGLIYGCLFLNDKAYQFLFIICIQFLWWWFDIWMFIIIFINYQLYLDYLNYCGRKTLKIIMNWLMKALIVGRRPPRILNTCSGIGLWSHVSDVKTVVWSQHPSLPHHSGPSYHSKTVQYLM